MNSNKFFVQPRLNSTLLCNLKIMDWFVRFIEFKDESRKYPVKSHLTSLVQRNSRFQRISEKTLLECRITRRYSSPRERRIHCDFYISKSISLGVKQIAVCVFYGNDSSFKSFLAHTLSSYSPSLQPSDSTYEFSIRLSVLICKCQDLQSFLNHFLMRKGYTLY